MRVKRVSFKYILKSCLHLYNVTTLVVSKMRVHWDSASALKACKIFIFALYCRTWLWKLYIHLSLNIMAWLVCCPHPLLNKAILLSHGLTLKENTTGTFLDTNTMYFFYFFILFHFKANAISSLFLILHNYDSYMFFVLLQFSGTIYILLWQWSNTKKLIQQVICKSKIKSHHSNTYYYKTVVQYCEKSTNLKAKMNTHQ